MRGAGASPDRPSDLPARLARAIALGGPIPVSQFMAAANSDYYGRGDPLGRDFITAPEISQMFGELIGAWAADLWSRAGRPPTLWVELGPGRGTLTADALRAAAGAGFSPDVHFVEISRVLRAEQAKRVNVTQWHADLSTVPEDKALIVVANEFFDALPIRQLVKGGDGWRERLVACQDELFLPIAGPPVPDAAIPAKLHGAAAGSIVETSPAGVAVMGQLAGRIGRQGGAALIVDYGYEGPAAGETLQAVKDNSFANPFDAPGQVDLSAHVDFGTLAAAAIRSGAVAYGPATQRDFLGRLGIAQRVAALLRHSPGRAEEVRAAHERLMSPDAMGTLFQAMAVTAADWPAPAGFA